MTKTVVLLLMARMALAWICVLAGRTPFARRVMIDLGRVRSYMASGGQPPGRGEEGGGKSADADAALRRRRTSMVVASLSLVSFLSCVGGASGASAEVAGGGAAGDPWALAAGFGAGGSWASSLRENRAAEASLLRWSDFRGGMASKRVFVREREGGGERRCRRTPGVAGKTKSRGRSEEGIVPGR